MTSFVNMSLEDIIQKKKRENTRNKKLPQGVTNKTNGSKMLNRKLPLSDARNKIISKKRNQIVDAREKLAQLAKQRDARFKLEQLRMKRAMNQIQGRNIYQSRGKLVRSIPNKDRVFIDPSRQVVSQPLNTSRSGVRRQLHTKKFMENRSIESRYLDKMPRPKPIVRTVENDIELIDDPMEDDYTPRNVSSSHRKASLQLKIIAHNNDSRDSRSAIIQRTTLIEKEKSPPRPPSILKKRPMAALRTEKSEKIDKPLEYRIIVSNLRNTVTGGDIEELFGDVGGMLESRLVRPGTAEVIYKTQEDAQRAVDLYHNRQLDGQPMNCLLVTPRAPTSSSSRSSSKPSLFSTNSNVEPDISTFHKATWSQDDYHYIPRIVRKAIEIKKHHNFNREDDFTVLQGSK